MNQRIWDKFLTERDKAVFAAGGFGARAGFGDRPALLDASSEYGREQPVNEGVQDELLPWHAERKS
jgi:maleamate amidohydrolase